MLVLAKWKSAACSRSGRSACGDVGRCGQVWGGVGRCGERSISMDLHLASQLEVVALDLHLRLVLLLQLLHHALVLLQHLGDVLVVLLLAVRDSGQGEGW